MLKIFSCTGVGGLKNFCGAMECQHHCPPPSPYNFDSIHHMTSHISSILVDFTQDYAVSCTITFNRFFQIFIDLTLLSKCKLCTSAVLKINACCLTLSIPYFVLYEAAIGSKMLRRRNGVCRGIFVRCNGESSLKIDFVGKRSRVKIDTHHRNDGPSSYH